jgi:phosphatidylserine/phosphatidylglycerophosphate/cardiolipin synthase-like enzyme
VSRWTFLEQDYLRSKLKAKPDPPTPAPGETPEQGLRRVQWRRDELDLTRDTTGPQPLDHGRFPAERDRGPRRLQPKIFHQKFILRDYRKAARPTTALLTGPANFTDTDTHKNLNSVFVFHDADVCRLYRVEVEQLRRGSFGRALHGEVPKTYDLGGVPVKVCSLLITRPSWSS